MYVHLFDNIVCKTWPDIANVINNKLIKTWLVTVEHQYWRQSADQQVRIVGAETSNQYTYVHTYLQLIK